ncbi:hypothetical protein PGT21_005027 [Puccinia graminis f. sp. tritici]|uniref:Uncharacterized protein n=1 Tax=Puccinia graminis f. sp. tritici TaxID=56615 RepID=A0A5B0NIV1_PUCGR|nr:hypothetical protein PGTUg99_050011 [Puccinia graminis f. sp. tritici]KAA1101033.1 hypothetical protein PGT21_005027 [Puccinia graminis f. sp. tritici]
MGLRPFQIPDTLEVCLIDQCEMCLVSGSLICHDHHHLHYGSVQCLSIWPVQNYPHNICKLPFLCGLCSSCIWLRVGLDKDVDHRWGTRLLASDFYIFHISTLGEEGEELHWQEAGFS